MGLRRNIVANYFGAGWNALMNIAFVSAYIHYLGAAGYGLIGVFTLLLGLMSLLDLGMAPTVSREMARLQVADAGSSHSRQLLRGVEIVAVSLGAVIALVVSVGSDALTSRWLSTAGLAHGDVVNALRVMGVLIGLRILENVYRSALIGLQRQVVLNTVLAITATIRNAGALAVLAWVSPDVHGFFQWQLVAGVITVVAFGASVYVALAGTARFATFSFAPLRASWRFAAGTMIVASTSIVLGNLDKILLTRLLPLDAFGYYALAFVVAQAPLGLVNPIAQAFYPRFTQLASSSDLRLAESYHGATQLVVVLLGSATAFLLFRGHPLLTLWLHDAVTVERVYGLACILALGSLLNGIMTLPYFLQLSAGWTSLTIRVNLVAIVLVVPALAVLVPRLGAVAAAWIWFALNLGYVFIAVPLMHRKLLPRELWRWYTNDVSRPLAAAMVTAALCFALAPATPTGLAGWCVLALQGIVIVVAAVVAAPLFAARVSAWRSRGARHD